MKNKSWLWGGAVVVVILIGYFAFFNSAPDKTDVQGAIGVAKQHRTDQIAAADVVLQDPEIQQLLQSEFFYKLATDDEFRKMAIDQLARLDLASGRSLAYTDAASLADMKMFLDLALGDTNLKQALCDGRMNVVSEILDRDGKSAHLDVANRIHLVLGRHPELNATALGDMKMVLDNALGNAQMRAALAEGRLSMVNEILVAGNKAQLADAAQKVFIVESRRPQLDCAGLADMKVFLDLAVGNADLKQALAEGRMERVREILDASNRLELLDAANRVYLGAARGAQLDATTLGDMKMFLDRALSDHQLKVALLEGRLEMVNEVLVRDGKTQLSDAAQRVFQADRRQQQFADAGLADMRTLFQYAAINGEKSGPLAEGRLDVVREVLAGDNKIALLDVANRVWMNLGRSPQLNATTIADMKLFLDLAEKSPNLDLALREGRMADVEATLITDGKAEMCLAANRAYICENRRPHLANDIGLANQRAIASFAAENPEFRSAMQDGRIDAAAQIALAAGKQDISLRHLQMTSFVLGDHRNFEPDLNRMLTLADSPSFRAAADSPGWGRLVTTADATSWRQTIDAVRDSRAAAEQQ